MSESADPATVLKGIRGVEIDGGGIFKYILIECELDGMRKTILRGYGTEEYHGRLVGCRNIGERIQHPSRALTSAVHRVRKHDMVRLCHRTAATMIVLP